MRNFLRYFLVLSLTVGLAILPWSQGSIAPSDYLLAEGVVAIICTLAIVWLGAHRDSQLNLWQVAGIVTLLILNALISLRGDEAFRQGLLISGYFLTFFCFYRLCRDRILIFVVLAFVVSGVFYSVYGIGQERGYLAHDFWSHPFQLSSRLINSSHFAAFLLIPILGAVGLLFSSTGLFVKLISVLSLPVMGWALLKSQSRLGWVCLVFSMVIYCFVLGRGVWKKLPMLARIVSLCISVLLLAGVLYLTKDILISRFGVLIPTRFQSLIQRGEVWLTCLLVFLHYPLGIGAGNLFRVSPAFKVVPDRFAVDFAHNELIQLVLEYGILGLAILLALFIAYQQQVWRIFRASSENTGTLSMHAGIFAGVMGVFLAEMADFPLRIPSNAFLFFAAIGLQLGAGIKPAVIPLHSHVASIGQRKFLPVLLCLGLVVFAFVSFRLSVAHADLVKARDLAGRYDWNRALSWYDKGASLTVGDGTFDMGRGELFLQRLVVARDGGQKQGLLQRAGFFLERAGRKLPLDPDAQRELGKVRVKLRDFEGAERSYKTAVVADPLAPSAVFELGHLYLDRGLFLQSAFWFRYGSGMLEPLQSWSAVLKEFYGRTRNYDVFKKVIPENPACLANFAELLYAWGDLSGFDRAAAEALMANEDKIATAKRFYDLVRANNDQARASHFARMLQIPDASHERF